MDKAKDKIPKQFRIDDTCFTSFSPIRGNLYTRHAKNLNRVHRKSKDLLSVIISLVTNVNCGKNCFMMEIILMTL